MSIRVTQHTMYNNMVSNMQSSLSNYMESVEQGSSQKKINRPSDDPAGTYRVLTTRTDITNTQQYQENVDTALGWLNLADDVLSSQATTAIIGLKSLAEQASTGTYTAEQRQMMAEQARQYFGQLLNLANTEYEGKSIFAGHIYDQNAFEQGLAVTAWKDSERDDAWDALVSNNGITMTGSSANTVLVQFVSNSGESESVNIFDAPDKIKEVKWSNDGGNTWQTADPAEVFTLDKDGNYTFKIENSELGVGIEATIPSTSIDSDGYVLDSDGNRIPKLDANGKQVYDDAGDPEYLKFTFQTINSEEDMGANNGTMLYFRPTAYYQGDDNDPPIDVTIMGINSDNLRANSEHVEATGTFGANVLVRIDGLIEDGKATNKDVDLGTAGEFYWSYSTDGGSTWVTAKGTSTGEGTARLPIPGGYVDIDLSDTSITDKTVGAGSQILVHPSRADLNYEVMKDTYIAVNSVGKDVFGGYYQGKPALEGSNNLFEFVGEFIGYLESNNQTGCQQSLVALTTAEQQILAEATRIGGIENRLDMAQDVLSYQKLDLEERLSYVEDIDLTELLTKLTRQQLTYQTVLQSSSMIMQLSLANYV